MEPNLALKATIFATTAQIYEPSDEHYTRDANGDIKGWGSFRLYKETGRDVELSQGCVSIIGGQFRSVSNMDKLGGAVILCDTKLNSVSSKGNVLVSESVVSRIEALGNVTLENGAVGEIETESNEGCLVKGSSVRAKITAKRGPVTVMNSYVNHINAFGPVSIESSVAGAVTIRVDNQRNGVNLANLKLNDAEVYADVTVKLREPKPSTPQDSSFYSGRAVKKNGQYLIFYSSTDRIRRYYDLMLTGENVQYPLSPRNIKFLQKHYKEPLDISEGKITDTHGKFVCVQGQNFFPNCTLYITGDGKIHGQVVFENCEGTVVRV